MKTIYFYLALVLILPVLMFAQQSTDDSYTYGEFKAGYGVTQFSTGLKERFESENFSTSGGGVFSLAAYHTFKGLNNIHFGLKYKGFGAFPSKGDDNQEMFFNFWGVSLSTKYFPFSESASKGLYIQGDYNFTTQFTQKYRRKAMLEFDHQFAIGNSLTLGIGYHIPLNEDYALVTSIEYDWAKRQGEVQGIGDAEFLNSNIAIQIGIIF
jgi:hypothetical protein